MFLNRGSRPKISLSLTTKSLKREAGLELFVGALHILSHSQIKYHVILTDFTAEVKVSHRAYHPNFTFARQLTNSIIRYHPLSSVIIRFSAW